ncbi:MAG: alpha-galactosidase [Anaerolineae bacterium]|nr:alpha-galactosidase [Anaerolineae bacterium]
MVDVHGEGQRLTIDYGNVSGLALSFEAVIYPAKDFLTIRIGVSNPGPAAVRLQSLTPLATTNLEFGRGPLSSWVNGYHSWSFAGLVPYNRRQPHPTFGRLTAPVSHNTTTRVPGRAGCCVGEGLAALVYADRQALVAGFIGMEDQFGQVYTDGRPGRRSITLQTTTDDVPLDPGQTLWGEWAIVYAVTLPDGDPLGPYANAVTRLTPGRFPSAGLAPGWSSWYQFFAAVTADDMARNQQALCDRRETLPFNLIQLDDGYQPAWGDWLRHNDKFPQGVDGWAEAVRGDGFTPGLWFSPFTIDKEAAIFHEHPEAILRDRRGRPVHGGFLVSRWILGLDPTHPATQEHVRRAVSTVVHEWGIPYLKLDFLYCGALPGQRYDPCRTRAQALRDGMKLIREVAGEEMTIIGCGCPAGPALGLVNAMRVSPDCAPNWYPRLFGLERPLRRDPSLPATRNAIRNSIERGFTHRRWWWLDADNLLVRQQQEMTAAEAQSYATVIGLTGSHLVLSDDLPAVSDERLDWVASLLPVLPGGCRAPGLLTEELPDMLVREMEGAAGSWTLLGLFNWGNLPDRRIVSLTRLGFSFGAPILCCDFWNRQVSIEHDTVMTGLIPPHGVALLALRAVTPGPQLVGSDLHFSMGGEIGEWKPGEDELRLSVNLGRKTEGKIWLKLPDPPGKASCDEQPATISVTGVADVYGIQVSVKQKAEVIVTTNP